MTTRIAVACACVLVGLGAIVGVASTAGPPEGYGVFHDRDVRVYVPSGFRSTTFGVPGILLDVSGPDRQRVELTTGPTRNRSLAGTERWLLRSWGSVTPDIADLRREDVDVPGADEARRITYRDAGRGLDITTIIARDADRFVTLSLQRPVGQGDVPLDPQVVEDSLAITS